MEKAGTGWLYRHINPRFYRDFSVLEFLRYMGALKGIPRQQLDEEITQLLQSVNLSGATQLKIGALSGGMRQRVGIVQAVLGNPSILYWLSYKNFRIALSCSI